ncbi:CobW family GTP-binding protein [Hydrogenothermus marinus]|uniref:G3E family GTPase n=1 Tax=Hydrogenothermus marinus TaxID=133270 RepID=A0A3M0BKH3_9AQUI|nr:GTP-binding protein [Hydrogenothermus marinus]RMA97116.1 G3E family GTPase [Hydrogenothermus marinus]
MHSFIITGFLGTGKTTLLINNIKKYFKDKKIAIVVNEFGEVGVDGQILKNVYSEVLEISEGCICCKLSAEFEKGVKEIIKDYNPEIIFIETSGTSEPFPIFLSLQNLGISVEGIICVIDAKNFNSYKDDATAKYQIGGSNIIVLNKIDLIEEKQLESLEKEVREIKEKYNIKNILTGEVIFKNYVIYKTKFGILPKEIFDGIYKIDEIIKIAQENVETGVFQSKHNFSQRIIYLPDNFSFEDIDKILSNIPNNIFRIKGIIKAKDVPTPLVVNYSFGDLSFSELPSYEGKSFLVFIGSNLETKNIIKLN